MGNSSSPSKRYSSYPAKRPSRPFHPYVRSPALDKPFKIVWNVPSFQCHKYGINFTHVSKWGITQNYGDTFRGDNIALLYDPGWFPALLETNADNDYVRRNGGVPQEGDIDKHLQIFEEQIDTKLIPDKEFSGKLKISSWRYSSMYRRYI